MRGASIGALLLLAAAGCGPKVPAHVEMIDADARATDWSGGPGVQLRVVQARGDTDGHLAVQLAIVNASGQNVPADAVEASFVDAAARPFPAQRIASGPIAAGMTANVSVDFDLAFAAEGAGTLQVRGLPQSIRPIPIDWVKRAPPPSPDERADAIARKVFTAIGIGILVVGYLALRIWAGE